MGAPFEKGRFRNPTRIGHARPGDMLRWALRRSPAPWPERNEPPGAPPERAVTGGRLRVTWVNHATVLIQMDGFNVLTDPVWSERVSPVSFAGPKRHRPPGLRFDDLPPIHLVLLSHDHYDHMDLPTLRRLANAHEPAVVTGLGNRRRIEAAGFAEVHELDWWQSAPVAGHPGLGITATPAQHFSGRGLFDRDRTLWCGFALSGPSGMVFFAGDTAHADHFAAIRRRLGPPRLALLPIGAYEPEWFMRQVHMSPADAVVAHRDLEAVRSLPIHFGTFRLSDEGIDDPLHALGRAIDDEGLPADTFVAAAHGAAHDIPERAAEPRSAAQ